MDTVNDADGLTNGIHLQPVITERQFIKKEFPVFKAQLVSLNHRIGKQDDTYIGPVNSLAVIGIQYAADNYSRAGIVVLCMQGKGKTQ